MVFFSPTEQKELSQISPGLALFNIDPQIARSNSRSSNTDKQYEVRFFSDLPKTVDFTSLNDKNSVPSVLDLSGVAVITGGASGFGLDVTERLVKAGQRVAILDVSADELSTAEASLKALSSDASHVLPVQCDVSDWGQCRAAADAIKAHFGSTPITFLFNNAGIQGPPQAKASIINGGPEDWAPVSAFSLSIAHMIYPMRFGY